MMASRKPWNWGLGANCDQKRPFKEDAGDAKFGAKSDAGKEWGMRDQSKMSKAGKIGEQKTQGKHKYSISLESGKAV
jgi:hypothetical protein